MKGLIDKNLTSVSNFFMLFNWIPLKLFEANVVKIGTSYVQKLLIKVAQGGSKNQKGPGDFTFLHKFNFTPP